jgi:hypothetical protein
VPSDAGIRCYQLKSLVVVPLLSLLINIALLRMVLTDVTGRCIKLICLLQWPIQ